MAAVGELGGYSILGRLKPALGEARRFGFQG
jgi:hypothetical protein